ncbi:MAG: lipid-A-disaccharide synthase N-terminal domain-containing protein [Nanoarchaeota archaeon]|nr:lipid-A-disaccharide synthase N-terminal domain-containing protein [Nanoarchaeota archaeon]
MNLVTALGFLAALLTTIAFIPQVIKSWKTKKTKDVSLAMFIILVVGIFLWLIYGLLVKDLPLIVANLITFILVSSILFLKLKHS